MIPRELLKKVRHIEIRTRNLVNDIFGGEYHSVFKGQGITFAEVREYQPGDDIRLIDWNVTARFNHPFVKVMEEERELTVYIVYDASRSGHFGTTDRFKAELAAEIGAVLGFSAIRNNDKVGLLIFSDDVERFIPPKKGRSHVLRVVRELLYHEPEGRGTNINGALSYLLRVANRRSVVFLISDFMDCEVSQTIQVANQKHDLIGIQVYDPREKDLPNVGLVKIHDAETDETFWLDTTSEAVRADYSQRFLQKMEQFHKDCLRKRLDIIPIEAGSDFVEPLMRYFRMREKRF
ncbi:MAG TPA: DUF58 domain-containing protein [Candidatus Marinimicrobia bacterium]|jgi:uncharacterized protein (DUF58 family)|nr:MAG: DUF58 domain-containing protein [Candidatus Neomarinimicrobiota bacterium]HIA29176.1 DUF58 domain-containing protein [Candidatus Neomarinimicrobiota bacterium]HIA85943.1 DUF58 domain-containing protein [Candidatus Neomarinimicrobiota bacterium]HIB58538.1 DUF58 domain-containing protein [Candidatus Neomarinimicrobiota bacterium]